MIIIYRKLFNIYLCSIPLSFICSSYDSAKNASFIYQNNILEDYEKKTYKTKESYMRYKMFKEFAPNLFFSLFGPFSVPILFIPKIIEHIEK
jgi:hypothetical protein